jgi:hypothetical protein
MIMCVTHSNDIYWRDCLVTNGIEKENRHLHNYAEQDHNYAEQDQRRQAGTAKATVRRQYRDTLPGDIHRQNFLLHRSRVPMAGMLGVKSDIYSFNVMLLL